MDKYLPIVMHNVPIGIDALDSEAIKRQFIDDLEADVERQKIGKVLKVKIMNRKLNQTQSNTCAYVMLDSYTANKKAIARFNKTIFLGKTLFWDWCPFYLEELISRDIQARVEILNKKEVVKEEGKDKESLEVVKEDENVEAGEAEREEDDVEASEAEREEDDVEAGEVEIEEMALSIEASTALNCVMFEAVVAFYEGEDCDTVSD